MTKARRKSVDSSDSSDSSNSSDSSHKKPKDKKDKDKKRDDKHKEKSKEKKKDKKDKQDQYGHANDSSLPAPGMGRNPSLPPFPHSGHFPAQSTTMSFPEAGNYQQELGHGHPPPPPSGYRIPAASNEPFPNHLQAGDPPFRDADGNSPIFVGSAIMENSVHPCKIGPHLQNFVSVPYGGGEHAHNGRYDLLPFRPHEMEWVPTSYGRIPAGRRAVEGGYEEGGDKLYHAVAEIYGVKVPGKAGEHLGGARISFGGGEHEISENYEILCWRY